MDKSNRVPSTESGKVTASGEELEGNDLRIEQGGEEGEFDFSDMKNLLPRPEDIKAIEKDLEENDVQTLINKIRNNEFSYMFAKQLLFKYSVEQIYPNDNFIKLVDVLTEWEELGGIHSYNLNEELTDKNWARYYSVLRRAELNLKDKTAVEIVVMARKGELHKSVIDRLAKEYISGREIPGDMNEKIKEALNELEK